MKILLTFLFFVCFLFPLSAQTEAIDSLIQLGIEYHDEKRYDKAIQIYKEALAIDPDSEIANYEIAISLTESGAYYEAIGYCDRLIDRGDKYATLAYNTKGSCLNYLGKTEEAIDNFLEGIERYPDFYLLHYNLGLAYRTLEDYDKAKEAFEHSVELNPQHAGSHLNLARTLMSLGKRIESLLPFYYFLFMEPNTERSEMAYNSILLLLNDAAVYSEDPHSPFTSIDQMLSEVAQTNQEKDRIHDMEIFIRTTGALFTALGDYQKKNKPEGFWWDFYVTLFSSMASAHYTDVFCHYISYQFNSTSEDWLRKSSTKVKLFNDWLQWQ